MLLGALGYSYSISTVAASFGHTAYGKLAFQDRLHSMEFYLNVCIYIYCCIHSYIIYLLEYFKIKNLKTE